MASLIDIENVAHETNIGASKAYGLGYNMSNWNYASLNAPNNVINIGNDNSTINLYGKVYIVNSVVDQCGPFVRMLLKERNKLRSNCLQYGRISL